MVKLPKGQVDPNTTFLMLEDGAVGLRWLAARSGAQRESVCARVSGIKAEWTPGQIRRVRWTDPDEQI